MSEATNEGEGREDEGTDEVQSFLNAPIPVESEMNRESDEVGNHLCRILHRKEESMTERKSRRASEVRNYGTVWMKRECGSGIRRTAHRMCLRICRENEYMEHYFGRTEVRKYGRTVSGAGEGTERNEQGKGNRFLGSFRTQLQLKRKNIDPRTNEPKNGVEGVESIKYMDVVIGYARRRRTVVRRRGIEGIRNGIVKRRSRLRQRRMVPLSEFRLFEESNESNVDDESGRTESGGQEEDDEVGVDDCVNSSDEGVMGNAISDVVAGGNSDAQSNGTVNSGNLERVKFSRSIEECSRCADLFFTGWADVKFLRCSGGRKRNQKYVCVSTVRMFTKRNNGDEVMSVIVNLIVEEE